MLCCAGSAICFRQHSTYYRDAGRCQKLVGTKSQIHKSYLFSNSQNSEKIFCKINNKSSVKIWWENFPLVPISSGGPALKARKFSTINHCAHDSPITLKEQRIIIMDSHIFNHQLFFQNLVAPPQPHFFFSTKNS